jgi:hypothetical protein
MSGRDAAGIGPEAREAHKDPEGDESPDPVVASLTARRAAFRAP